MKTRVKVFFLGFALVCLAALGAYGQQKSDSNDTSLGDLARQLKAQKAKEPKPTKVITNDNLTTSKDETAEPAATSPAKGSSETTTAGTEPKGHDEQYYRSRMGKLQDQLDTDKRQLSVLQQKLGQNDMQYYSNPQDSLMQQYSRSDINKLTAEIDAQKQKVANDEKAIDDLRDELRQDGGDPSWLR